MKKERKKERKKSERSVLLPQCASFEFSTDDISQAVGSDDDLFSLLLCAGVDIAVVGWPFVSLLVAVDDLPAAECNVDRTCEHYQRNSHVQAKTFCIIFRQSC
jgi:hypothetical protein